MRKDIQNPGIGTGGLNKLKTRCVRGHLFTKSSVHIHINKFGTKERRCKQCSNIRGASCRRRLKERVFAGYGSKCSWPNCDVFDLDMLTLDHIGDDGADERVRGSSSGTEFYRGVLKRNFPKKYQCLCANHNLKKEIERQRQRRDSK